LPLDPTSMGFGSENGGPFTLEPNLPIMPNAWVYSTQIVDKLAGHSAPASLPPSAQASVRAPLQPEGRGEVPLAYRHRPVANRR
jgi:hypothetical protein